MFPDILPEIWGEANMETTQSKAVRNHRSRQRRRGIVRIEVQVPEGDAPLLREIGAALRSDPARARETRAALQRALRPRPGQGLLELLACELPDEVVEEALERPRDLGRDPRL
jgi:hypothetical protein